MRLPLRTLLAAATVAGVTTVGATVAGAHPTVSSSVTLNPKGSVLVTYRGNGHGHGMSQYGAYGAALAGLSYRQILAYYYPGTTLASVRKGSFRVLLGNSGSSTTVLAQPYLQVSGVSGNLKSKGVRAYRLTASGTQLALQRLASAPGSTWKTLRSGLPSGAEFSRPGNDTVRLLLADGSSTDYYGRLRAVRTGSSVSTVNVVGYNAYAAGVAPREMPASWSPSALQAQATAARTYAMYEKAESASRYYDVCDTTMCQVYGGHAHYAADGTLLWTDLPVAATSTMNQVLTYQGQPIFAQYSASNGGWSTAGNEPYLRAAQDPYDPGHTGDPYVGATETMSGASFARKVGLRTVTQVAFTRDGNGAWGGRVVSAVVSGTSDGTHPASVTISGQDLENDLGLGTTWIQLATTK